MVIDGLYMHRLVYNPFVHSVYHIKYDISDMPPME